MGRAAASTRSTPPARTCRPPAPLAERAQAKADKQRSAAEQQAAQLANAISLSQKTQAQLDDRIDQNLAEAASLATLDDALSKEIAAREAVIAAAPAQEPGGGCGPRGGQPRALGGRARAVLGTPDHPAGGRQPGHRARHHRRRQHRQRAGRADRGCRRRAASPSVATATAAPTSRSRSAGTTAGRASTTSGRSRPRSAARRPPARARRCTSSVWPSTSPATGR